jgi:hypothetical protein
MRVFISSVVGGFEEQRRAAVDAVTVLGHEPITVEQFAASSSTPQQACLAGVREADLVVLILGERYGEPQPSGLSPTHDEYREARDRKPVLVFVEADVDPEPDQRIFITEVEGWATGHFRSSFSSVSDLRAAVTRGLHEHELAQSSGAVDENEMLERAHALVPSARGMSGGELVVVVTGGPHQQVIRPAEIEDPDLARDLQREALFGDHSVLDPSEGTDVAVQGDALVLGQRSASVLLDQVGSIRIVQPLGSSERDRMSLPAIIEEDVTQALAESLRFVGWLLDRIDPVRRLTDVVVVASTTGASYMAWRTRAEHDRSPNAGSMGGGSADIDVTLSPPRRHRQALVHDADRLAQDLAVLLRRQRG